MDRYPGLKNAQFLQGQFTFNELPVWYRDNRLGSLILHVQVWQVTLLGVHVQHTDNQTPESVVVESEIFPVGYWA